MRKRGYKPQFGSFAQKSEAVAWARQLESEMDRGVFVSRQEAERTTLGELLDRYEREITPGKVSSCCPIATSSYNAVLRSRLSIEVNFGLSGAAIRFLICLWPFCRGVCMRRTGRPFDRSSHHKRINCYWHLVPGSAL